MPPYKSKWWWKGTVGKLGVHHPSFGFARSISCFCCLFSTKSFHSGLDNLLSQGHGPESSEKSKINDPDPNPEPHWSFTNAKLARQWRTEGKWGDREWCRFSTSSPPFFLRDSRACETRAHVKISPREIRRQAAGREKNSLSPPRVAFSRVGWFSRPTVPEKKWGTTRSLVAIRYYRLIIQIFSAAICRYEMMRSCWLENPLMRPTFAEITKRFHYYLQEYKVLSWVFLRIIH